MTDKEFSNLSIGNSFIMGNKVLKVVESSQCIDCFFKKYPCDKLSSNKIIPKCLSKYRDDKKGVIFKEIKF